MNLRRYLFFLSLFFAMFLVVGCQSFTSDDPHNTEKQGIKKNEILIGSSLPMEGESGFLGRKTLRGALSYIKHINSKGGVHGRKIRLIVKDDGYNPTLCVSNTQKLIIEDKVFCLFNYVGTSTTVGIIPLVEEAQIPLVGVYSGADALRKPFVPYIINIRPSYYQESQQSIRRLVSSLGFSRIAILYQYDAYGFDGLKGVELAMRRYGMKPVASGSYRRESPDMQAALTRIADSKAEAVVLIGTPGPSTQFIRKCAEMGYHPVFLSDSFVGAHEMARRLKGVSATLLLSQVLPPPFLPSGEAAPYARKYVQLLSQYYPDEVPDIVGFEGYVNAQVLVEGLMRSGPDLSRSTFIQAVETIRNQSVAPGKALSFSQVDHQGLDDVNFILLQDGTSEAVTDWDALRQDIQHREK